LSRAVFLVLLAFLVVHLTPAQGQSAQRSEPKYAYYLREIGGSLGVKPLWATNNIPTGHREVRIWIGFGLFAPEIFTQIESDGSFVRGKRIFWWSTSTDPAQEAAADRDSSLISDAELYANLRQTAGCGARQHRRKYEMCTASLAPVQSWSAILTTLDSLGIATLPDAETLTPPGATGLDGWSIVVEVREGLNYRAYHYWSPEETASQPEVQRAAAIDAVVLRIGYRK
jgi:hypothetical protein